MKINALARPDPRRIDDDRERDNAAVGSFDDELGNARRKPDDLDRARDPDERPRDPRDDERDPREGPPLAANPHDPTQQARQTHPVRPTGPADRALGDAALESGARTFGAATARTHLGPQATQLLAAQAALPEGAADIDQIRFSAAAEAASAGVEIAAAEPALDAFATLLASLPGDDDDREPSDTADGANAIDARTDLRAPEAPKDARAHAPIRDDAQLATRIADAVNELAASTADRSDVVRFRTAAYTFAAVIRHDVGAPQVRLVSDDPNVRAFLGDRLPEVRQALERVGFASTGLSVAADSSSRHHERQPDPRRDDDERDARDAPRIGDSRGPRRASRPDPAADVARPDAADSTGLHLIV